MAAGERDADPSYGGRHITGCRRTGPEVVVDEIGNDGINEVGEDLEVSSPAPALADRARINRCPDGPRDEPGARILPRAEAGLELAVVDPNSGEHAAGCRSIYRMAANKDLILP